VTTERFAALKHLFEVVADLPHEERAGELRRLNADAQMIAEVLALHVASTATTSVSSPIAAALASAASRQPAAGDTVGVWHLEREIGRGGMGSVFLAERSDGHFRQRAALKVVRCIPRRKTLERFARERQLLATLTHPNIARLLDGGATPQGEPYLVMEYVDGEDIEHHCRRHRLGVRPVLALFLTACSAVAFAHRQLVVHCDLKPSNLLIDREGRPVLLDFGIARLIEQAGPEKAPGEAGGQIQLTTAAFTPRYASPEQQAHGAVTTASDIYSLGVLLAELLAQAADHGRLGALRRRELDAIVLRATRHDPAERYPTVDALMSDIRRFLAHQPVRALGGRTAYRTRKLLVRRWPWVAVAAAFLLIVAGLTSRLVTESRRAHAAELAALRERDRAQQISGFLMALFDHSKSTPDVLEHYTRRLSATGDLHAAEQCVQHAMEQHRLHGGSPHPH
jgi:eukaryotic-like serine/threonine-protein kinase